MIRSTTVVDTSAAAILTSGTTDTGSVYHGAAVDGSASAFFFPSVSTLDTATSFDTRFAVNGQAGFPSAGITGFRFSALSIDGAPTLNITGGVADLALVGQAGISSGSTGGTWNLDNLRSLFLGTDNGAISMSNKVNFASTSGSGFKFLECYARGASGDVTLNSTINLPTAGLIVSAENNVAINGTVNAASFKGFGSNFMVNGNLSAGDLAIKTTGSIMFGLPGSVIKGTSISLKAGGILTLNMINPLTTRLDLSGATQLQAEGTAILLGSDIILPSKTAGAIKAGIGNLSGPIFSLGGFDTVESAGKVTVMNLDTKALTVTGNVTVNGNLNVNNANVGGWLWAAGTISPRAGTLATILHVLKADAIEAVGGLNFKGTDGSLTAAPGAGYRAFLDIGKQAIFSSNISNGINGANFSGGDALPASLAEGGDGGTLSVGSTARPVGQAIDVSQPIIASTGANGSATPYGGTGGTVNLVANGTITVNSAVTVSGSTGARASKNGGNIAIYSKRTSGPAINVTNSGQLLSLLSSTSPGKGGMITFASDGGDIRVTGGTVAADRGTVDIRNYGANGNVQLTNASIRGDTVKIGALGAGGQLLIGGGTISADTTMKLYAGSSSGQVRFTDNVTLGGNSTKTIAGMTVAIDSGKLVTVGGTAPATVYTNNPNYTGFGGNGTSSGTFGGQGATTKPFVQKPAF